MVSQQKTFTQLWICLSTLVAICVTMATPLASTSNPYVTTDDMDTLNCTLQQGYNEDQSPLWITMFDKAQLTVTVCGFVANVVTFITLTDSGKGFSPTIRFLLQHQALVDSWVCCLGILILVQPFMWKTGIMTLDLIICYVIHSQVIYWSALWLSIWNLVVIAIERYLAICHPFKHQHMKSIVTHRVIPILYFLSVIILIPVSLQVRFREQQCYSEYFLPGVTVKKFMSFYSIFWFVQAYAVPCALFFILYGLVLLALRNRRQDNVLGSSKVIDKANKEITKMSIIVTTIFIISLGFDSWYYLLGKIGVTQYMFNSPLQKIGVFFSVVNSCVNPYIYAASMPVYRESIIQTFCCKKMGDTDSSQTKSISSQIHSNK